MVTWHTLNCAVQGFSRTTRDPLYAQQKKKKEEEDFRLRRHKMKHDQNHYYVFSYIIMETHLWVAFISLHGSWWERGPVTKGGHVGILRLFAMWTRGSLLLFCRLNWGKVLLGLYDSLLSFGFTDCIPIPFIPPSSMVMGLWDVWGWGDGENADWERDGDKAPFGGIHMSLISFMYLKVSNHKAAQCSPDPPSRLVQSVLSFEWPRKWFPASM